MNDAHHVYAVQLRIQRRQSDTNLPKLSCQCNPSFSLFRSYSGEFREVGPMDPVSPGQVGSFLPESARTRTPLSGLVFPWLYLVRLIGESH